jgi:nucleoid DNA-binding protein
MLRITPAFRANTAALRATPAPRRCACIAAFRLGGLLFWRADASSGPGGRSTFAAGTTRPKALSKTEAIEKLAEEHGMKKTDVTTVVNGLLDLIQDSVKAGEKVTLTGCAPAPAQRKAAQRSCLHATGLGPDVGVPRRRRPGSAAAARRATRRLLVRALRPAAPARQRRSRRAPGLPPMAGRWKSLTRPLCAQLRHL